LYPLFLVPRVLLNLFIVMFGRLLYLANLVLSTILLLSMTLHTIFGLFPFVESPRSPAYSSPFMPMLIHNFLAKSKLSNVTMDVSLTTPKYGPFFFLVAFISVCHVRIHRNRMVKLNGLFARSMMLSVPYSSMPTCPISFGPKHSMSPHIL
jgi:hypothetical protein